MFLLNKQLHDRDNHDTLGDNKAGTSATLLLDTSLWFLKATNQNSYGKQTVYKDENI